MTRRRSGSFSPILVSRPSPSRGCAVAVKQLAQACLCSRGDVADSNFEHGSRLAPQPSTLRGGRSSASSTNSGQGQGENTLLHSTIPIRSVSTGDRGAPLVQRTHERSVQDRPSSRGICARKRHRISAHRRASRGARDSEQHPHASVRVGARLGDCVLRGPRERSVSCLFAPHSGTPNSRGDQSDARAVVPTSEGPRGSSRAFTGSNSVRGFHGIGIRNDERIYPVFPAPVWDNARSDVPTSLVVPSMDPVCIFCKSNA